jgi:hypothetical protein
MTRSATDIMQEIIFAAVVDSLDALKAASKGVPNTLLRDIGAIHTNSTFADLPKELQATITASVRGAFNRLLKEGYSVAPRDAVQPQRAPARDAVPPRRPPGGGNQQPVRRGGRPPPKDPNRPPRPRRPK